MSVKFRLPQLTEEHLEEIEDRLDHLSGNGLISGYDREQKMLVIAAVNDASEIVNIHITFPVDDFTAAIAKKIIGPDDIPAIDFTFAPHPRNQQ